MKLGLLRREVMLSTPSGSRHREIKIVRVSHHRTDAGGGTIGFRRVSLASQPAAGDGKRAAAESAQSARHLVCDWLWQVQSRQSGGVSQSAVGVSHAVAGRRGHLPVRRRKSSPADAIVIVGGLRPPVIPKSRIHHQTYSNFSYSKLK